MNNEKLLVLVGTNDDNFKIGQVYLFAGVKSSDNPNRYRAPRLYRGSKEYEIGGGWFVDVTRTCDDVTVEQPLMGEWWHFIEVLPENLNSIEVKTVYGTGDLFYKRHSKEWMLVIDKSVRRYKEDDILFINNKVCVLDKTHSVFNPLEYFYLTGTVEL